MHFLRFLFAIALQVLTISVLALIARFSQPLVAVALHVLDDLCVIEQAGNLFLLVFRHFPLLLKLQMIDHDFLEQLFLLLLLESLLADVLFILLHVLIGLDALILEHLLALLLTVSLDLDLHIESRH